MSKTERGAAPGTGKNDGTAVRLNRYLSIAGVSSRRKADEYILAGRVSVNGRVVVDLGRKIRPETDSVFFNGKQVVAIDPVVYILLNKPKDCITTLSDEKGRRSVLDVVNYPRRIFPVGRLDRNTTGALILTNDGDFAQLMMHPRNKVPKSYLVTTGTAVSESHLRELASGIRLADGRTAPAGVELIPGSKNRVVGITIREGRNRQIHRMFQALGYGVEKLDRVAYGPVSYEGLSRGEWRQMTPAEVRALKGIAGAGAEEVAAEETESTVPRRSGAGAGRTSPGSRGRGGERKKAPPDRRNNPSKARMGTPAGGKGPAKGRQRSPDRSKGPAREWKRSPSRRKGPGTTSSLPEHSRSGRPKDWNRPEKPKYGPPKGGKRSPGQQARPAGDRNRSTTRGKRPPTQRRRPPGSRRV
jgi:pseudouridine synthase